MNIILQKHLWPYVHKVDLRSIGLFITSNGAELRPAGPVYSFVKNDENITTDDKWVVGISSKILKANTRLKVGDSPIITWVVAIVAVHTKGGVTLREPQEMMDFLNPNK